jgi:hypothetical protein
MFVPLLRLAQRLDLEGRISVHGQLPIRHQLFAMNLDPGLHQAQLRTRQLAGEHARIRDRVLLSSAPPTRAR